MVQTEEKTALEDMLEHQTVLNVIENRICDWINEGAAIIDCSFDSNDSAVEGQNLTVALDVLVEAFDLFKMIRSVISRNGVDKSLNGYFNVTLETFLQYLTSSIPSNLSVPPTTQHFEKKTSAFSLLLWLFCLPSSIFPLSHPFTTIRRNQAISLYENVIIYRTLFQCIDTLVKVFSKYSEELHNEDESQMIVDTTLKDPNTVVALWLLIDCSNRCHWELGLRYHPRKVCLEAFLQLVASKESLVSSSSSSFLVKSTILCHQFRHHEDSDVAFLGLLARCIKTQVVALVSGMGETKAAKKKSKLATHQIFPTDSADQLSQLTRFFQFTMKILPRLPADLQLSLVVDTILASVVGGSGALRNTKLPIMEFKLVGGYFRHFESSMNCQYDESWDIRKKIVNSLITLRHHTFDTLCVTTHLDAIFEGLANLIGSVDDFDHSEGELFIIRTARRGDIADLLTGMLENKNSFFKACMTETDPSIQTTLKNGWIKLFKVALISGNNDMKRNGSGGVLFFPSIVPVLQLLVSPKFKPIWKYTFAIIMEMFNSIQQMALSLYTHQDKLPEVISGYVSSLGRAANKNPSEIDSLINEFNVSIKTALAFGFGKFYRELGHILYKHTFCDLIQALTVILHDAEEPSTEALSVLEQTQTDALSATQLKSKEAFVYRSDLRKCIGSAFRTFGSRLLLNIEALNLSQLVSLPLTSPSFSHESNSWVLPLMAEFVGRDELLFFQKGLLPLAFKLKQKSHQLGNGELGFVESRHYKRLYEQIWALLPKYFDEPIDLKDALCDDQLINAMISELNGSTCQEYVCAALGTLFRQITPFVQGSVTKDDECEWQVMQQVWESSVKSNLTFLKAHTNKFMGILTVRYLQTHRSLPNSSTMPSQQSNITRNAQMLLEGIRSLVPLCDPNILESNLNKFSATWQSAVASAASAFTASSNESNALALSPRDYGALVDVVDALIPQLPEDTVASLFSVFLQLLKESASGLLNQSKSLEKEAVYKSRTLFNGIRTFSDADLKKQTLQCLLRRAFKGLKHVCERFEKDSKNDKLYRTDITSLDFLSNMWKVLTDSRDISRSIALKPRMSCLRSAIQLISQVAAKCGRNDAFMQFFKSLLPGLAPEVLLGLAETNKIVRNEAQDLLQAIAMTPIPIEDIIYILLPGLAGRFPAMKSSTIISLTMLFKSHGDRIPKDVLGQIFPLILTTLKDEDKQFRSTKVMQRNLLKEEVPEAFKLYIEPMLKSSHANLCRVQIRYIIEKAVKKVGVQALESFFPENDRALLAYVDRAIRRRKLRLIRHHENLKTIETNKPAFKEIMKGQLNERSDTDSDFSGDDNSGARTEGPLKAPSLSALLDELESESDNEAARRRRNYRKSRRSDVFLTHIIEGAQPMDLLSPEAAHTALAVKELGSSKRARVKEVVDDLKVGLDGRLIVEDNKENSRTPSAFGDIAKPDGPNPFLPTKKNGRFGFHKPSLATKSGRKSLSDLKDKREALKRAKQVRRHGHFIQKSKDAFKSERAAGDVTKNANVMPYSYMRLNPSMIKEKHRADAIKSFKENLQIRNKGNKQNGRKGGRK